MKNRHIYILAIMAAGACSQMDGLEPQGGIILTEQLQEVNTVIPSRADASFNGMYTKIGAPESVLGSGRPDDFGFVMMAFSNDIEAADVVLANSGYNWFSACGFLSSRNADYANPYIRYAAPYNTIAAANEILKSYPSDTEDAAIRHKLAQAKAVRAFAYLNLAPYFQFGYAAGAQDQPCVPLVTEETTDFTNNPRASVADIYALIISDLTYAIENLGDYVRSDKSRIDRQTARTLPDKNIITRAVGAEDSIKVDFFREVLTDGDLLLLCSDGLTNMVTDQEIARIVFSFRSLEAAADRLIFEANMAGGKDNISAILINPFDTGRWLA